MLSPAKFETLITKDIATHKGNGLDAETADEMAQPPIGSIGRHSIGRHPASGEDTQRMVDHQKEDNQRPNDRNLIEKLLFHPAKVRKKKTITEEYNAIRCRTDKMSLSRIGTEIAATEGG